MVEESSRSSQITRPPSLSRSKTALAYMLKASLLLPYAQALSDRVMVRVGGGWDTLDHFLLKHDPCRSGISGGPLLSLSHVRSNRLPPPQSFLLSLLAVRASTLNPPCTPQQIYTSKLTPLSPPCTTHSKWCLTSLRPAQEEADHGCHQVSATM